MKPEQSSFAYLLNDMTLIFKKAKHLFARLSPFILLAGVLIIVFPYALITGKDSIQSNWLQLLLLPWLIANLLFAHFIFCKFFRANFFIVWIIELSVSAFIIYLLI